MTWTIKFGHSTRVYYTWYHTAQFARALDRNGTPYTLKESL